MLIFLKLKEIGKYETVAEERLASTFKGIAKKVSCFKSVVVWCFLGITERET